MKSYQISRNGQTLGEFVESQIHEGLKTGYFLPTDWCWSEGMTEWQELGVLFLQPQAGTLAQPGLKPVASEVNPYAPPRANLVRKPGSNPIGKQSQLATPGARFGANMLDSLSIIACCIPFALMSDSEAFEGNDVIWMLGGSALLLALVVANCVFIVTKGQTLGKKIVGIRTATMDGENAGFARVFFLRFLLAQGLLGIVPLWGLIDVLFIFGDGHRCLHDKIAGTQVLDV